MKKIFSTIFVLFFLILPGFAGEETPFVFEDFIEGDMPPVVDGRIVDSYLPDQTSQTKYIRINFHFMLDDTGNGNFTETDNGCYLPSDPLSVQHTGYWYSRKVINMANYRLYDNKQMNLLPGNNTPVLNTRYRYVLKGVYFHRNSQLCQFTLSSGYGSTLNNTYGEDLGEAINIFFTQKLPTSNAAGFAVMSGNRYVVMHAAWEGYCTNFTNGYGLWVVAGALNHEIGHNLSLYHTMRLNYGPCSWSWDDYCDDTPTRQEAYDITLVDPCCGWNGGNNPNCSNNLMDYSGSHALTPDQIARVHYCLVNSMCNYWTYSYSDFDINGNMTSTIVIKPGEDIILDGSPAVTEDDKYFVSVQKSDKWFNRYGTEHMRWLTAQEVTQIGAFDIRNFCDGELTLEEGCYYRVKLAVESWHEKTLLIYISGALEDRVPVMTSNALPYGVAEASSVYSAGGYDYNAWKAFDGEDQSGGGNWTMWISQYQSPYQSQWVSYEFEVPTYAAGYYILPELGYCEDRAPKNWRLEGFNGNCWMNLDEQENILINQDWTSAGLDFPIDVPRLYQKYRLKVKEVNGSEVVSVRRLKLKGPSPADMVPIMESNNLPTGVAQASSIYLSNTAYDAWKAFDGDDESSSSWTMWISNPAFPFVSEWLSFQLPSDCYVTGYFILPQLDGLSDRAPKTWNFEAWNGSTWVVLDQQTNITWGTAGKTFQLQDPGSYDKYRLVVTQVHGSDVVSIRQLKLLGNPVD